MYLALTVYKAFSTEPGRTNQLLSSRSLWEAGRMQEEEGPPEAVWAGCWGSWGGSQRWRDRGDQGHGEECPGLALTKLYLEGEGGFR